MLGLSEEVVIVKLLCKNAISVVPISGIWPTAVNDIKRNVKELEKMQTSDENIKVRKTMKPETLDQLSIVMYPIVFQARDQGIPLSGP